MKKNIATLILSVAGGLTLIGLYNLGFVGAIVVVSVMTVVVAAAGAFGWAITEILGV